MVASYSPLPWSAVKEGVTLSNELQGELLNHLGIFRHPPVINAASHVSPPGASSANRTGEPDTLRHLKSGTNMAASTVPAESNKFALLVGVNTQLEGTVERCDIKGKPIQFDVLHGCKEDIDQVEKYLVDVMKVQAAHITKLLSPGTAEGDMLAPDNARGVATKPATYSNIVDAFKHITETADEGDQVYIHYSGHGARATTIFPELKGEDARDECIVPCDIFAGGNFIRDLEIALMLRKMVAKELVVTVVLDCCFSGGATRKPGLCRVRRIAEVYRSTEADHPTTHDEILRSFLPSDVRVGNTLTATSETNLGWRLAPHGYTLLAACCENQAANEIVDDDGYIHGVLTYWLLDSLRNSPILTTSVDMLFRRICARISRVFENQTPLLAGERNRLFFNSETIPSVNAITVSSVNTIPSLGSIIYLAAGRLHGVCIDAEYAIFGNTCRNHGLDNILGRVVIIHVDADKSIGKFVETYVDTIQPGCQAVLARLPLNQRYRVGFSSANDQLVEEFNQAFQTHTDHHGWLCLDSDKNKPSSFLVSLDDQDRYEIQDGAGVPLSIVSALLPAVPREGVGAVSRLLRRIKHLAQYRLVQGLENENRFSGLNRGFSMEIVSMSAPTANAGTTTPGPMMPKETGGLFEVEHEAEIYLRLRNQSDCDLHVALFNLTPRFGIEQIWPEAEDSQCIGPGGEANVPINMEIAPELIPIAGSVPVVDTLKAFATLKSTSLLPLELVNILQADASGLRGRSSESDSDLQTVLDRLTRPRRETKLAKREILDWQTVELRFRTLPQGSI